MTATATHDVRRRPTIASIQGSVAETFGITMTELLSERRLREVARPRQAAMYLAQDLTLASLPTIGRAFERDHTTVMHACRVVTELMRRDPEFAEKVEAAAAHALRLSGDPVALLQHAALAALDAYFGVARPWVSRNPRTFLESGFGAIPAPRPGIRPPPLERVPGGGPSNGH